MFSKVVAIRLQQTAKTEKEAKDRFKQSCTLCCNCPEMLWHSCEKCAVAGIHEEMIAELEKTILV